MDSRIWYRAELTAEQVRRNLVAIIAERFAAAVRESEPSDGACLFTVDLAPRPGRVSARRRPRPAARLMLFFSPASIAIVAHIIAVCGAEPCEPPGRSGAVLVVGQETDWARLAWAAH